MSAIDTGMLAAMRDAIGQLLPDTCRIITITHAADGQGGMTDTRGTASSIDCRLDVISGREQIAGGALQPFTSYVLSVPYDTEITTLQEVLHSSITYSVVSVNTSASWNAVKRVQLEKA